LGVLAKCKHYFQIFKKTGNIKKAIPKIEMAFKEWMKGDYLIIS